MIDLRTRRILFACVASNALFGIAGLVAMPAVSATLSATGPTKTHLTASSPTTAAAGATTTTAPAADGNPSTAPSSQVSSAPRSAAHTSTTAAVKADDVTGIASSASPSGPVRIAPSAGSYPVTFSGTSSVNGSRQSVPATGTINLAKSGTDVTQTSPDAPGDVVLVEHFSNAQANLTSMQLTASDTTKTFSMPSGVTYLLFNSPQGTSWNWSATSTDGKTHITATGTVGTRQTLVIGGVSVPTIQLTTDITISGDINGSAQLTTWVSPELRLPVKQRQVINAKAKKGFVTATLNSDVTTTLQRLTPG